MEITGIETAIAQSGTEPVNWTVPQDVEKKGKRTQGCGSSVEADLQSRWTTHRLNWVAGLLVCFLAVRWKDHPGRIQT
jgi:hypothetical protein